MQKGLNIDFRSQPLPTTAQLREGGFRIVRGVLERKMHKRGEEWIAESMESMFAHYDPLIDRITQSGATTLLVLNQQTHGNGLNTPWDGNQSWEHYAIDFGRVVAQAVARYRNAPVVWQIWNEPDVDKSVPKEKRSSVRLEPAVWGELTRSIVRVIRSQRADAYIYGAGLCNGAGYIVNFVRQAGLLPVDVLAVHPYGVTLDRRYNFDPGWFGPARLYHTLLSRSLSQRLAITEFGVAADKSFAAADYPEIAAYYADAYAYFESTGRYDSLMLWAWSDWNRNGGMVTREGTPKQPIYARLMQLDRQNEQAQPVRIPASDEVIVRSTAAWVNLRDLPSTTSRVVERATNGQVLKIDPQAQALWNQLAERLGQTERWIAVRGENRTAFVLGELVRGAS